MSTTVHFTAPRLPTRGDGRMSMADLLPDNGNLYSNVSMLHEVWRMARQSYGRPEE
jgi:hypothetical protein